jgi:hypothetical protein
MHVQLGEVVCSLWLFIGVPSLGHSRLDALVTQFSASESESLQSLTRALASPDLLVIAKTRKGNIPPNFRICDQKLSNQIARSKVRMQEHQGRRRIKLTNSAHHQ